MTCIDTNQNNTLLSNLIYRNPDLYDENNLACDCIDVHTTIYKKVDPLTLPDIVLDTWLTGFVFGFYVILPRLKNKECFFRMV